MWNVIHTYADERIVMHRRVTLDVALNRCRRYKRQTRAAMAMVQYPVNEVLSQWHIEECE